MKPFVRLLLHTKIKTHNKSYKQTLTITTFYIFIYIYTHYYTQPDIAPQLKQITQDKHIHPAGLDRGFETENQKP